MKLAGLALTLASSSLAAGCVSCPPKAQRTSQFPAAYPVQRDAYNLSPSDYQVHPLAANTLETTTSQETLTVPAHRLSEVTLNGIPYTIRPLPKDKTIALEKMVADASGKVIREMQMVDRKRLYPFVFMPTNYSERTIKNNSVEVQSQQPLYLVEVVSNNGVLNLNIGQSPTEQRKVLFDFPGAIPEKVNQKTTQPRYEGMLDLGARQRIVAEIQKQIPNQEIAGTRFYFISAVVNDSRTIRGMALKDPSFNPYLITRGLDTKLKATAEGTGYALVSGVELPVPQPATKPATQPATQPATKPLPRVESIE